MAKRKAATKAASAAKPAGKPAARPTTRPAAKSAAEISRRQAAELLGGAVAKSVAGEQLSRAELAALRDYERGIEAGAVERYLAAVPQKTYRAWCGRQTKILHDQAELYGAPLDGPTVNLPELVRWLHDWLARHKHQLSAIAKGADEDGAPKSMNRKLLDEQLEQSRQKNRLLELELAEREGELLPRELVHAQLGRCASVIRAMGVRLTKRYGNEAGDIVRNAIEDFAAAIDDETAPAGADATDAAA